MAAYQARQMKSTKDHINSIMKTVTVDIKHFQQFLLKIDDPYNQLVSDLVDDITTFAKREGNLAYTRIDNIIDKITKCELALYKNRDAERLPEVRVHESQALATLTNIKSRIQDVRFLTIREADEETFAKTTRKNDAEIKEREKQAETILNGLATNEKLLDHVNKKLPALDEAISSKLNKIDTDYNGFENLIKENSDKVREILGIFTAEKIGINYKNRSVKENTLANSFRIASITIMTIVLIIDISYCTLGIIQPTELLDKLGINFTFNTVATSTVIAMSFLMYIPALFLSKESNRHRKLQDENLQLSNDIDAVLTFISSLPETDQLALKSALALVLITGRQKSEKNDDGSTLLTQEIIKQVMATIKPRQ